MGEEETEVNNADKLFMDNQNLKKRVAYLSNELEMSKTKCKDLQSLINSTVQYLKSNGKQPLQIKKPKPVEKPAPKEKEKEKEKEPAQPEEVQQKETPKKDEGEKPAEKK